MNGLKMIIYKKLLQILKFIGIISLFTLVIPFYSNAISAYFNQSVFKNDEKSSYVEVYIKVSTSDLSYELNENNKYQAQLYFELSFSLGDSNYISDRFYLLSPETDNIENIDKRALLELKRYILPYGIFNLNIKVNDHFKKENKAYYNVFLSTRLQKEMVTIANIEIADTIFNSTIENQFSKHSKIILPNVYNSIPDYKKTIYFYTEVYNSNIALTDDEYVFIKFHITKDDVALPTFDKIIKLKNEPVLYVVGILDIDGLSTGFYNLNIDLVSSKNMSVATKNIGFEYSSTKATNTDLAFEENVKKYPIEILAKYIEYLYFIETKEEYKKGNLLLKDKNPDSMQLFFTKFWVERNAENPGLEWQIYLKKIEEANKLFTTQMREGYLTDRGRVYVIYGPPNSMVEDNNPSISYPYQIWHYYTLTNYQHNKRFVFFNKTGALDEYELLHSDATGEHKNPNWKEVIKKFNKGESGAFGDFLDRDFDQ